MSFAGSPEFINELHSRKFLSSKNLVKIMNGEDVYGQYFAENGFSTPVLVPDTKGLRIKVPSFDFTLDDVVSETDPDALIDVILVRRQNVQKMPLKFFVDRFFEEPRVEILNSLSFEFSRTRLGQLVKPPHVVSELCLVENIWPDEADEFHESYEGAKEKPNVQKYCIMSMADSYTDFHVDFGGSSVWYHVLWGEKVFYLIAPTPENLDKYWEWHSIPDNRTIYFPDRLEKSALMKSGGEEIPVPPVYRLKVFAGQTVFLPSGWIHAVYTPQDSLVFGGNFLTKLTVPIQLSVYRMEEKTKTEDKFLFPYFEKLHWLLADYILGSLQNHKINKTIPEYYTIDAAICLIFTLEKWLKKRSQMPEEVKYQFLPEMSLISTKNHSLLIRELDKLIKTSIPKNYRDSTLPPTGHVANQSYNQDIHPPSSEGKRRGRKKKVSTMEIPTSPTQGFRPIGGGIAAQMKFAPQSPPPINPVIFNRAVSPADRKDGFKHLIGLPPVKKLPKPSLEEKLLSPPKLPKSSRNPDDSLDEDDELTGNETEPTTDFQTSEADDSQDTLPKTGPSQTNLPRVKHRSKRRIKPNRRFLSSEEDEEDPDCVSADQQRLQRINRMISGAYISNFSKSGNASSDYSPSDSELQTKCSRKDQNSDDPSWKSSSKKGSKSASSSDKKSSKKPTTKKKSSAASARQRLAKRLGIK